MGNLEDIEKLHEMKKKGIISEAEFETQKAKLLQSGNGAKSQLAYCLLAFFLGTLGIHNFYVGRWKRGLAQLLITVLTFGIGAFITNLWSIINIFAIHTDGKGEEFEPCRPVKYILGILGLLGYIVFPIVFIGGIAGYTMAMRRYKMNELVNYSSMVAIAVEANEKKITSPVPCESFDATIPEFLAQRCTVYPNRKIIFSGVDEKIKTLLVEQGKMQEDASGNLIFSF